MNKCLPSDRLGRLLSGLTSVPKRFWPSGVSLGESRLGVLDLWIPTVGSILFVVFFFTLLLRECTIHAGMALASE